MTHTAQKTLKLASSLLILTSQLWLSAPKALAQNTVGLTTMPPRVEDIIIEAGQAETREIKVRNDSSVDRYITTSFKDFVVTDESGTPVQLGEVDAEQSRWAASSWLQISPTRFSLKPGETKSLMLTVIAPDNATPGGHYAMVLFTPDTLNLLNNTGSVVQSNVASLVYITIPGDIKEDATVNSFTAPKFSEYGPVDINTMITNLSDVHITPQGSIKITNMLGGTTANLPLDNTNIFTYTSRELQNTLGKKWLFGRFKAQLQAAYGTQGQALTATLFFWVIPWRLIILLITLISIITSLIIIIRNQKSDQGDQDNHIHQLEKELETLKNKYKDRR